MNKTEKFWDKVANKFDKVDQRFEKTHIKTVEYSKKHLNGSDIVLDYGCLMKRLQKYLCYHDGTCILCL